MTNKDIEKIKATGGDTATAISIRMSFTFDNGSEGEVIANATWAQIEKLLQQINSDTRCFFTLNSDSGDYLQCAGGEHRISVELRQILGNRFKHFVLGKRETSDSSASVWTTISCRVGPIN